MIFQNLIDSKIISLLLPLVIWIVVSYSLVI